MNKQPLPALALALSAVIAPSAHAMTPVAGGPQIVLYISQSLGSGSTSVRLYGLRIDEIHPIPNTPLVTTVGLVQRRELVNLQIVPHSDVRIQLARRVTWDFTHEEFGSQSNLSRVTIGLPFTGITRSQADNLEAWGPRASSSVMPRSMAGGSSADGLSVMLLATVVAFSGRPDAIEIMPPNWRLKLEPLRGLCNPGSC